MDCYYAISYSYANLIPIYFICIWSKQIAARSKIYSLNYKIKSLLKRYFLISPLAAMQNQIHPTPHNQFKD